MQRRKHSIEFKQQVVQEAIETGNKALVANNLNFLINSSVINTVANSSFKVANELKFLRGESDGNKTKRN